jgi:hypothetical protein
MEISSEQSHSSKQDRISHSFSEVEKKVRARKKS